MLLAMYLPTPGKIAIIGAGPIGLEAALYGRYLGYAVEIFERGRAAENVLRHGDAPLATPFVLNASPLGLAALAAQDESFRPPQADEVLTYRQWIERYLQPLAQSDLVVDGLREQTAVVSIEHLPIDASPPATDDEEDDSPPLPSFRLQLRTAAGEALAADANLIIDASGAGEGDSPAAQLKITRPSAAAIGPDSLITSVPNYYIIGRRAAGDDFTFAQGLGQIRDLFTLIGGRTGLNLYATMPR